MVRVRSGCGVWVRDAAKHARKDAQLVATQVVRQLCSGVEDVECAGT